MNAIGSLGYCSHCGNDLIPVPNEEGDATFAAEHEIFIVLSCGVAAFPTCDDQIEVPVSAIFGD